MREQDIKDFIHFFTHHKSLTRRQIVMRDRLISRDCSTNGTTFKDDHTNQPEVESIHNPKETARFLSLFSNPDGLKFLTHDFDPNSTINFAELVTKATALLREYSCLPKSLVALMSVALTGKSKQGKPEAWLDYKNVKHEENFSCEKWIQWSNMNGGQHPLNNPEFAKTIMLFRSTIRIVKPALQDLFDEITQPYKTLKIEYKNIEKADFYTNVWVLRDGLNRILKDIDAHSKTHKQLVVEFGRKYGDEFSLRIIRITHVGSYGSDIEDVKRKVARGGGAFSGIKKRLEGYCDWSVETLWNDEPIRWNILNDTDSEETEALDKNAVNGFTHILTFYQK